MAIVPDHAPPAGAAANESTVTFTSDGRLGLLELNRPERRNALSAELLADFHRALDAFEADPELRVGVLSGRGPSFCAGFDLSATSASTQSTLADPWADRARLLGWIRLGLRIWECPKPIISQVHGHCLAGGIMLPLCSDLVFVSETCVLGWARLPMGAGFLDAAMATVVGARRAKEVSYVVGSRITGLQAADWGFANRAVPAEELAADTLAFARRVARTPRSVLEMRKAAITRGQNACREALLAGVEWDVIAHADVEVNMFRGLVREYGMADVIAAFESSDDPAAALRNRAGGQ